MRWNNFERRYARGDEGFTLDLHTPDKYRQPDGSGCLAARDAAIAAVHWLKTLQQYKCKHHNISLRQAVLHVPTDVS